MRVPKKVRRLALKMALSQKLLDQELTVLDTTANWNGSRPRTLQPSWTGSNSARPWSSSPNHDEMVEKSARNIPNVKVLRSEGLERLRSPGLPQCAPDSRERWQNRGDIGIMNKKAYRDSETSSHYRKEHHGKGQEQQALLRGGSTGEQDRDQASRRTDVQGQCSGRHHHEHERARRSASVASSPNVPTGRRPWSPSSRVSALNSSKVCDLREDIHGH